MKKLDPAKIEDDLKSIVAWYLKDDKYLKRAIIEEIELYFENGCEIKGWSRC